ncbi:hypothetical protein BZL30_6570 [Mycobacterium kansasii]|uniref:Uncharacterized protein n=1 Tax=Mycobacterium kansasii TaxID=1768 RepID=A0A1V3X5T6_MYCKA|nr:hypothetical protein BZL30_6570 [Mycobacterium kansasii]OOK74520.1 hypothetical protein BZL29_4554 [Mycobacterium kansasii]
MYVGRSRYHPDMTPISPGREHKNTLMTKSWCWSELTP